MKKQTLVFSKKEWSWLAIFLLLQGMYFSVAQGATIFGVVSERAAPEVASGAKQFLDTHSGHAIQLRTKEQISEMTSSDLKMAFETSDILLFGGVFGEPVTRLLNLLEQSNLPRDQTLIAFNGDKRLTKMSRHQGHSLFEDVSLADISLRHGNPGVEEDFGTWLNSKIKNFPKQRFWIKARAYWQNKNPKNLENLMTFLSSDFSKLIKKVSPPVPKDAIRYYQNGKSIAKKELFFKKNDPIVIILDLDSGDSMGKRELLDAISKGLKKDKISSCTVLARWGLASQQAVQSLSELVYPAKVGVVISLQDFVIGGGGGREQTLDSFRHLNVPVMKGIRMIDKTEAEWRVSDEGLAWDTVHYRLAMPELQGVSQPYVLATAGEPYIDAMTGIQLKGMVNIAQQISKISSRASRWIQLKRKENAQKRVAIIYYNHPPGRHNIGADNLDVPASLWEILYQLKQAGYKTGHLPSTPEALLDMMQERGVNLPENAEALRLNSKTVNTLHVDRYKTYFSQLPPLIRLEMSDGPLGFLDATVHKAITMGKPALGKPVLIRVIHDLKHMLEEIQHPAQERALRLIEQMEILYREALAGADVWTSLAEHRKALLGTNIEGLGGWGPAPGNVMIYDDQLLLPGIQFGNIFIGPQPPRGWEVNEEILHANRAVPPPHQYLGFYHWIHDIFKADALVHLGRHSTYEFLPRHRTGLAEDDYPSLIAGDIPGIYPYIVDGVGEGIQAKRRGLAVMIDHLTPPLETTPLYDDLLQLRQLVESFEANEPAGETPAQLRTMRAIREKVISLHLEDELVDELKGEHALGELTFEEVDDDMLVHEIGHYLTEMQEDFMPLGLHVFGRDWKDEAIDTLLASIYGEETPSKQTETALRVSPKEERSALLNALEGGFVLPGKGNDPIRTPEALPTGRNFHALDSSLLPTRIAWELGSQLASQAQQKNNEQHESVAVVLWASDTVRDEGAMIAFGLKMLGVKPIWNSRGIVKGIQRLPLDEHQKMRRDTMFTLSGLFRDLYGAQVDLLDRAVLLALDASSLRIQSQYPELSEPLEKALSSLQEARQPDQETFELNHVARQWVEDTLLSIEEGQEPDRAARLATLRLFGAPPGGYGAGINRMVERSGAWESRREVAAVYLRGMAHAYGAGENGLSVPHTFRKRLKQVGETYLGRASNLYSLLDNNDAFDYLGGLSMAIEHVKGQAPANHVISHANPSNTKIEPLQTALLSEFRGRFLNPEWLKPLMGHGYAGARTMGSEFMEYLWGWQITNPEIIQTWAWDEVHDVYFQDRHDLGLDSFLEQGQNVHVKINMQALLLVVAHKGFWEADQETLDALAKDFARLAIKNGLPGSGHTKPDHPIMSWIMPKLNPETREAFEALLAKTQLPKEKIDKINQPIKALAEMTIDEIDPAARTDAVDAKQESMHEAESTPSKSKTWLILVILLMVFVSGIVWGIQSGKRIKKSSTSSMV